MSYALEKEQAVAGYINLHKHGERFELEDIYSYIMSLWNAGVGPIRLNFIRPELQYYLEDCKKICLDPYSVGYVIDKSRLDFVMTPEEREFLKDDQNKARSFALFCKLRVDLKTPDCLLDAMGFRFMYAD